MLFMLRIRMQRVGRRNDPSFRIVITDSRNSTKSGGFIEVLGNFDYRKNLTGDIKKDRLDYWLSVGAKPTDSVHNYLVSKSLIKGKKINVLPKKSPIVADKGKPKGIPKEGTEDKGEKIAENTDTGVGQKLAENQEIGKADHSKKSPDSKTDSAQIEDNKETDSKLTMAPK